MEGALTRTAGARRSWKAADVVEVSRGFQRADKTRRSVGNVLEGSPCRFDAI